VNNKRLSDIGSEVGRLCEEKNEAYGDSFAKAGDVLEALYPNGVQPHQYTDMLGIIRVVDKLFRIATRKDAFGESPWRDIAGYGILGAFNDQKPSNAVVNTELRLITLKAKEGQQHGTFLPGGEPVTDVPVVKSSLCCDGDQDCCLPDEMAVFEEPLCEDCWYMKLSPSDMPCKKCIDKPFKPHFTLSVPVYSKPPMPV